MRILFLTDNFPPEVNAPASRTFEHCSEWVRAGHDVTVITCAPNFPRGRVFEGYENRLWQREVVEGIEVIRVWSYVTANEGFVKRSLDYVSYMLSAILASPFVRAPDVIVATSPQFFTACAGYAVSRLRRRPFVFEVRDLWPESIAAVGAIKQTWLLESLELLELFLYRRSAGVISVTHAFRDNLASRGIDPEKVEVVTNGAGLARFTPRPKDPELLQSFALEGKFVAGYIGTHGLAHGLETILEAARLVQSDPSGRDVRFLLLGEGARKAALQELAKEMLLENVVFLDPVSKDDVVRYWSLLDVTIIHLKKAELFKTVIPSKLFEAMAMGLPILHGVEGESAAIVARHDVGVVFEPENAVELAHHVLALAGAPARRHELSARARAAAATYSRPALAAKMLETLRRFAGDP